MNQLSSFEEVIRGIAKQLTLNISQYLRDDGIDRIFVYSTIRQCNFLGILPVKCCEFKNLVATA